MRIAELGSSEELNNHTQISAPTRAFEKALNLSPLQSAILEWLHSSISYWERRGQTSPVGVRWKDYPVRRAGKPGNDSRAVSRALLRLEERGLVIRMDYRTGIIRRSIDDPPPAVTTSVNLTQIGRQVAAIILTEKTPVQPGR